jgi:hypothetical protein
VLKCATFAEMNGFELRRDVGELPQPVKGLSL